MSTESEDDLLNKALDCHRSGRHQEASELYQRIVEANPAQTDALYLLGVIAHQTGNHVHAVELFERLLAILPSDARCYNVLGLALIELGREHDAELNFKSAIAIDNAPESHNNLGNLWKKQGRLDDAIDEYKQALEQSPGYANANYNLALAYRARSQPERAAECFRQAVKADPEHAGALAGLGQLLHETERSAEAVPFLERALGLMPYAAALHCDLGDALYASGQIQEAGEMYRKAIECNPKSARSWYSAGCFEASHKEFAAAVDCFRKAVEIDPAWSQAQHNLGHALFKLGQADEALEHFRLAAGKGDPEVALAAIAVLIPGVPKCDNRGILEARRAWAQGNLPLPRTTRQFAPRVSSSNGQIRIGYVSSFFQDHNWMKPVWGLINQHDRQHFEVHLFSDAPASAIQCGYLRRPQDQFHDITGLSNEVAADLVEQSGIDILVDLNGYSTMPRLALFALRPAPVIVGWFNMYATTGMASYDYLVGDDQVIPPEEEQFYSEKIVRVPGSYLTFDMNYPVPPVANSPCLTNRATTYGCLASQYKITTEVIVAWSTILHQVPGSILILKNSAMGSEGNRQFVRRLFEANQITAERVRLEGPAEHYQFLKTYDEIDIALDTFPYNGGTTTTEAIWQGVPVVTYWGDRWAARTSASLLLAGGIGDFVGEGIEGYKSLAIGLGNPGDFARLANLRYTMRSRLLESPVCDTRTFARNIETLYRKMFGSR